MTTGIMFDDMSSIGDFAAEKGINGQTLKNAVDKLDIKYVAKVGATHLYLKADLITAMGNTSQAHKVGYVHPDKYKELQDLHQAAVLRVIELEARIVELTEALEKSEAYRDSIISG